MLTGRGNLSSYSINTGPARSLLESATEARTIASFARSASAAATTSSLSLTASFSSSLLSAFHSTPASRQQQIEDVVRDPVLSSSSSLENARAAKAVENNDDAFLSLPEVQAATRGPLSVYRSRRLAGLYRKDPRQESAMLELQTLFGELEATAVPSSSGLTMVEAIGGDDFGTGGSGANGTSGGGGSWLSSLFGSSGDSSLPTKSSPKGLYMYGGVGTGKTMLMDVFSECCSPLVPVS